MLAKSKEDLQKIIEEQCHDKDANIEVLVRAYKEFYSEKLVVRLVQDINSRAKIYDNLMEEIKRIPPLSPDENTLATQLKEKYERFNLISKDFLPNPTVQSITRYILDKLASFARAILDIIARYANQMAEEIRISPEVTVLFQIGLSGWTPGVTIGIERSGSRVRTGTQPVA